MATTSTISIKENGKVRTIYCHWDGHPSHNGAILLQHYTTTEKVNELINLGDLSSLRPEIKPKENEVHSFDKPLYNVTIAYMRDRGEIGCEPTEYSDESHIQRENYNYLFLYGVWFVNYTKGNDFSLLTEEMCEIK